MHSSLREDYGLPWAEVQPLLTHTTAKAILSHCTWRVAAACTSCSPCCLLDAKQEA